MKKSMIRVRLSAHDAHYGGNLVNGSKNLDFYGDIATELMIMADGDEGLFRTYEHVDFLAPLYAGDFVEAVGWITKVGNTSRAMEFETWLVARARPDISASAADILETPVLIAKATAVCVVPKANHRKAFVPHDELVKK